MITHNFYRFFYESGISLILLYALYHFFFRRETYFRFNRYYLLSTLVFSLLIPFVSLRPLVFSESGIQLDLIFNMAELVKYPEESTGNSGSSIRMSVPVWQIGLLLVYVAGVALILYRFISGLLRIRRIKNGGTKTVNRVCKLVNMEENMAPFSFFRTVYMNDRLTDPSRRPYILEHELVHVRQLHTLDNLFTEVLLALFWFNPVMWLLRKSLRSTHEYLADLGVKREHPDIQEYQAILLGYLRSLVPLPITNNFNSLIKNRIQMMYKKNSNILARMKPLFILPVLLSLTFIFACSDTTKEEDPEVLKGTVPEDVYFIVDEMPVFNEGDPAIEFRKFIAENLVYPEIAIEKGISGRVIVQFAVNSEGKVVDAVVVRGVDPSLDKEAVRVVESSPEWTPGKQEGKKVTVLYTFPINFVLK